MPTKAEKLLAKGQTLERKGKVDKALELYRDACKSEPYDPDLWTARAEAALKLGQQVEAAEALFRVSELFARGGMPLEALKMVRRVLELDKDHGGARRFARMLENRVGGPAEPEAEPSASASPPAPEPVIAAPEPEPRAEPTPEPVAVTASSPPVDEPQTILIDADEPEPGEIWRTPAPAPEPAPQPQPVAAAAAAPAPAPEPIPVSPSAVFNQADSGAVSEFQMGTVTGEMALETLSLGDRLAGPRAPGDDGNGSREIPLDDEPRFDVVQAVASTLSSSPLLSELDSDLVKTLVDCGTLVHRAGGVNVFRQGELGTSLYLILQGEVAVIREAMADAPTRELARLRAGAFFGEMALLTNAPRSATVKALRPVDLLEVSRRDVRDLVEREPRVLKLLMRFFRARLVGTLLQTSPLFRAFSRDERKQLVASFRLRELGPGRAVIEEGAASEGLFMVLAGRLEAVRADGTVLGALAPGDVFGEMSLLDDSPAMASVKTRTRGWVLLLPRAGFAELTAAHPAVRAHLANLANERRARNRATTHDGVREQRLEPI